MTRPAILRLNLVEFRNHAATQLALEPAAVVLTGPNGAGKTNLLEAVSFLAPGRGLRRAALAEVARAGGTGEWAVGATVLAAQGPVEVATGREAGAGERRLVRLDGVAQRSQAALAGLMPMTWLTPAMDRLFLEGAEPRRRFLDRLALGFDPDHAVRAQAYDRAMRERLRLLKEGTRDPIWMGSLEAEMAAAGTALAAARRRLAERLGTAMADGDGPFPAADLEVDGSLEAALAEADADTVADRYRAELASRRSVDAEAGATTAGPHRSDLAVRHRATGQAAQRCSTGEQKALLIAILLAQARLLAAAGQAPLLLLDEVAAHLDRTRRLALFEALAALPGQAWLTGTEPELFAGMRLPAQHLAVDAGHVRIHA